MSLRYTVRKLPLADCTVDNMKDCEMAIAKDAGKLMFRNGDKITDITSGAAEYALAAAEEAKAAAKTATDKVDTFDTHTEEVVARCEVFATAAKTSETNAANTLVDVNNTAKVVDTAEKSVATMQTQVGDNVALSKAWATSTTSPDNVDDTNSSTGKTQSARSWALVAEAAKANAATSEANAKTSESNAKTSETGAATSASSASTSETNATASATGANDKYLATKALFDNTTKHTIVVTYDDNTTETINILGVNS